MFLLRQWISCIALVSAIMASGCAQHSGLSHKEELQTPPAKSPVESAMAQGPAVTPADVAKKSSDTPITSKSRKRSKRNFSAAKSPQPVSKPVTSQYPSITLNNPFKLKYGQKRSLPDTDLHFKISKVNDSRCPLEMHCSHQGKAVVTLTLYRDDKRIDVLNISANDVPFTISDRRLTYHIQLLGLQPYPTVQFIDIKHYVAEFVVTKASVQ
jgi:hypothetical protein